MSDPAKYRAICQIADYCSTAGNMIQTLREVLSAAESALPGYALNLVFVSGDECQRIRAGGADAESGPRSDVAGSSETSTDDLIDCISGLAKPCYVSLPDGGSLGSAWAVPLNIARDGYGALLCEGDGLGDADRDFLLAVARCVSLYLTSTLTSRMSTAETDSMKKRIEEVSAIYEISQAFDNVPIEDLLRLITKKAAAVMDAQACSLMLKDPDKDELVIKASYGLSESIIEEARVPYGHGVAGRVAEMGRPMLLSDLQRDPRFSESDITPRPEVCSSICVPLRDEEARVQGVLSISRTSPAPTFNEDDVKVFSVFASQAALAISNAHLYSNLKDRVRELLTLYEISRELSEAYSLEEAARVLVHVAVDMVGGSAILLLFDSRQRCKAQAVSGLPEDLGAALVNSMDDASIEWIRGIREPQGLSLKGKQRASTKRMADVLKDYLDRVSLIPLVAEDTVVGILILGDGMDGSPDRDHVRLLSIITSQAAMIIKNASRYEEQIDQKALELSALYELSERISTAGNLKEALDSILDIVRDIVWYDESFISTVDYERNEFTVQACRGMGNSHLQGADFAFSEDSLSAWAINERKALLSPDISKDPRFTHVPASLRGKRVRSLMAIPLIVHDEVVGILNVHGYAVNLYTEENVRTLSVIASQAAALYKELEALSALASYTDNLLRSVAAGVLTLDRDGMVLTWNTAAEDIIGIPASRSVGRHFSELVDQMGVSRTDKERLLSIIRTVLEKGEKFLGFKQEYRPENREPLYTNMNIAQLRNHAGETLGLVIIFEDITKEIQMESEMRRISELAAIGQLAASIAHELRNPLSSIKGAAQYLRKEYEDHTAVREFLDIIIDEVNVLNKVTTEFLDFARPAKLNLRETDINDVLFRTLQFMQLDIAKQDVEVIQDLTYDIPRILADDKQLEQVFRNIVLNALQAMPNGGKLTISSHGDEDRVRVIIQDTGIGIPEETLDQIFVPFFTTKTKGTGLGLAIVQKIVDNHGGWIAVDSITGHGTKFEILLPVCSDRARAAVIHAEGAEARGEVDILRRAQPGS